MDSSKAFAKRHFENVINSMQINSMQHVGYFLYRFLYSFCSCTPRPPPSATAPCRSFDPRVANLLWGLRALDCHYCPPLWGLQVWASSPAWPALRTPIDHTSKEQKEILGPFFLPWSVFLVFFESERRRFTKPWMGEIEILRKYLIRKCIYNVNLYRRLKGLDDDKGESDERRVRMNLTSRPAEVSFAIGIQEQIRR